MKRWIPFVKSPPIVAVIRLQGVIASGGRGQSLDDAGTANMIEKAFTKGKPAAVALVVNSPGGSPVQSSLIASRIRRLAEKERIPVIAFVEDVAASGGYWLASAADEIWLDRSSIVGSIGVISAQFGFTGLMEAHGVERRVYTAGKSKSGLDPFKPEKPADVKKLRSVLDHMHETFKDQIRARRGDKLSEDPAVFSGEFWVGQDGIDLGLADGIGHLVPKLKERFGDDVKMVTYTQKRRFLSRFGASIVEGAIQSADERATYDHYSPNWA